MRGRRRGLRVALGVASDANHLYWTNSLTGDDRRGPAHGGKPERELHRECRTGQHQPDHLEGKLERSLAGAVPSVAGWRLSGLQKRLERDQVDALLESCDRSTVVDVRDLAILTVLARLGLHAGVGSPTLRR